MNAENTPKRSANQPDGKTAGETAFRDAPAGKQMLTEQREHLWELRALEEEIAALTQQKSRLEVECIVANMALNAATTKPKRDLDPEQAVDIALALRKKRQLEQAFNSLEPEDGGKSSIPAKELEQLKRGRDALVSWLDATRAERPQRALKLAYAIVSIATMLVILAAVAVHPILLLLLLGLGVVIAFLRSSEQNTVWFRLGAKRHFNETGLRPPTRWEDAAVRARVLELETQIESIPPPETAPLVSADDEPDSSEQLMAELALATTQFDTVMAKTGLDASSMDTDFEQWLELLATARQSRQDLDEINAKLKSISAGKQAGQEALFQFLSRQGEAPPDGSADLDTLSAGLDRLEARSA